MRADSAQVPLVLHACIHLGLYSFPRAAAKVCTHSLGLRPWIFSSRPLFLVHLSIHPTPLSGFQDTDRPAPLVSCYLSPCWLFSWVFSLPSLLSSLIPDPNIFFKAGTPGFAFPEQVQSSSKPYLVVSYINPELLPARSTQLAMARWRPLLPAVHSR